MTTASSVSSETTNHVVRNIAGSSGFSIAADRRTGTPAPTMRRADNGGQAISAVRAFSHQG